jgi:hypothetical protein
VLHRGRTPPPLTRKWGDKSPTATDNTEVEEQKARTTNTGAGTETAAIAEVHQSNLILQTTAYASTLVEWRMSLLPASRTATTTGEQKIPCDPSPWTKQTTLDLLELREYLQPVVDSSLPYLTGIGEGDGEEGSHWNRPQKRKSPFSHPLYCCSREGRKERDTTR